MPTSDERPSAPAGLTRFLENIRRAFVEFLRVPVLVIVGFGRGVVSNRAAARYRLRPGLRHRGVSHHRLDIDLDRKVQSLARSIGASQFVRPAGTMVGRAVEHKCNR